MYASSPAIRDASKKQVPKHKEYTAVLDWIESMLYKEQPEDPLGFLRDLLANPPQVSALSVAKPIEVPQPAVSTELPSSGENGPILEMAAEMYTRLIEDNRALWEKNQTKQKEVQNEMESLVTQLNKNNAHLAEENQALKQQLEDLQDAKVEQTDGAPKQTSVTKEKTKHALLTGLRTGDLHKAVDKMEEDMAAAEAKDAPPDPAAASSIADLTSVNTSLSADEMLHQAQNDLAACMAGIVDDIDELQEERGEALRLNADLKEEMTELSEQLYQVLEQERLEAMESLDSIPM